MKKGSIIINLNIMIMILQLTPQFLYVFDEMHKAFKNV